LVLSLIIDTFCAIAFCDNNIAINWTQVNAWINQNQYKTDRAEEYPSIQDQLDMQYWDKINSTNTWQDAINAVKTKYPKQ
jgi:hypothetical protein